MVRAYGDDVFRLAYTRVGNVDDAKDIYQSVFLKLYTSSYQFETGEHIKAWLLKVTATTSIDLIKSVWHSRTTKLDDSVIVKDMSNSEREKYNFLWSEVMRLPQKLRVTVHLYYYYGYSTEQIADIINAKPSTVRSRLDRARKKLRERLGDEYV